MRTEELIADPKLFISTVGFFMKDLHSTIGAKIPEEILAAPVVMPVRKNPNDPRPVAPRFIDRDDERYQPGISIVVKIDNLEDFGASSIIKRSNMAYPVGSRPEYNAILLFDSIETGEDLKERLGIAEFQVPDFGFMLKAAVDADVGIMMRSLDIVFACEPDRLNQHMRSTLPKTTMAAPSVEDIIANLTDHNLRPEELEELNILIAENSSWIASIQLSATRANGMFTNILILEPKPGYTKEQLALLVEEFSSKAIDIKSPFLVMSTKAQELPYSPGSVGL